MQWSVIRGELVVRCKECMDFFAVESSTEVAGVTREGREAVMPDGRPVRSIGHIAMEGA